MTIVFFFNDTATTEIYTLSLHDALPICLAGKWKRTPRRSGPATARSWHHLYPESQSDSGNQRAARGRAGSPHGVGRRHHRRGDGPHHLLLLLDGEILDPADRATRLRSRDAYPRQPNLGRGRTEGRRLAPRAADALLGHRRHRHDWLRVARH